MAQFLEMTSPPTAIFAANDHMALGAWDVLKEKKIPVPTQMALAGFDDIPEADAVGLTSVRQPLTAMARQAGTLLMDWVRTAQQPDKRIPRVSGKIMVRVSTGAATD